MPALEPEVTTPTRQLSQLTTNSRRIAAFVNRQAAKLTGSSAWIARTGVAVSSPEVRPRPRNGDCSGISS